MSRLINNENLQHYTNKMCNADNRKVGSKSLPTALNDIDSLIDEMKTNFDAEYGTPLCMKLENNENVFSVGTGTNVDKRSEVENSFTDVELSGNSVVNLADEWKDVTNETISFYYGAERSICKTSKLKNNTYYTLIANYKINLNNTTAYDTMELGLSNSKDSLLSHPSNGETNYAFNVKDGLNVIKFHFSDYKHNEYAYFNIRPIKRNTDPVEGESVTLSCSDLILLEGDWTNKPIPQYFQGLKSIGEKEDGNHKISISSVGKNLFEPTVSQKSSSITANTQYSIENNGYSISISSSVNRPTTETASHIHFGEVKLKIGETYVVSADKMIKDTNTATPQIRIAYWDKQNNRYATIGYLTNHTSVFTFTVESGKEYVALGLYSHGALLTNGQTVKATYEGVRLYLKSTSNTSYEPHKSDKKEISLNEPLRGLPNGIKDTIEKINGEWKIVRRCGEVVLDGNRTWAIWSHNTDGQNLTYNAYVYSDDLDITKKTTSDSDLNVINDKVTNHYRSFIDRTGESIIVASSIIHLSILRTKLETQDTTGLKKWLSQNPIKVVYELKTPIIEDISPVTLQCWKNGTISINEVLPVETTHTVALNKPAQIKRNIEELTELRNRVNRLEDTLDVVTLEQALQFQLLNHSINLDK